MNKKFYITTAIPYVNAPPHIGHALEMVQADTIARFQKQMGFDVCLLSGGDENALKNVQAAQKANIPIQKFVDTNTQKFLDLTKKLNCQFDIWQKSSDHKHHYPACQKLWELCQQDIYKKTYTGLYCVGCEVFYDPSELINGECSEHPGKKLEKVSEENYFFKLSKYQDEILNLIKSDRLQIIPQKRKNEVLSFVKKGLQDISISRSNERAKNWGIPVPNDNSQRMYVWFDALNIYQSGIGFNWDKKIYQKWWPADMHIIGKGIVRFHAVYWIAFLLSAKLQLPKTIWVHEYFTVNGQKMSKTLGNVIDPVKIIEKYGIDAVRYYLLAKFSPFSDGNFSENEFKITYNADLANGLGNLIARVTSMSKGFNFTLSAEKIRDSDFPAWQKLSNIYEFDVALKMIWQEIKNCDAIINNNFVWGLEKDEKKQFLDDLIIKIRKIAYELQPFMPETAAKIIKQYFQHQISIEPPLFPRIK